MKVSIRGLDGYVSSESDQEDYLVWFDSKGWTCDCCDYIFKSPKRENYECKHIKEFKKCLIEWLK